VLVKRPLSERARAALCLAIIAVLTPTIAWLLSQASPAWANRYLAVALAPFLLLAAGGLAHARRLGVVGLVLVVIMWAQDAAPVEKSNVRAITHAISPSLQPCDLIISTQPESIPVLHYYLPPGLKYATLTGAQTELGVWDWRDGVERLEATTPEKDLAPVIDALPVGARVVLVEPITWTLNRWRAPWTALVRIRSKEWAQWLSNDPRLEITAVQPANFTPPRPNPVRATVMVKTG
jgi:mannosyltransferase